MKSKKSLRCRSTPTGHGQNNLPQNIDVGLQVGQEVDIELMTMSMAARHTRAWRSSFGLCSVALFRMLRSAQQEIVTLSDAAGRNAVVFSHEHPERSQGSGSSISGFRRLDKFAHRERQAQIWPGQFSRA